MDIVAGAPDQRALPASRIPVFAAIFGTPEGALIGSLNEGVDALGAAGGNRDIDLSDWRFRQTVTLNALPRVAGVMRHEDAATRAAAEHGPRVHDYFPSARHQSLGIAGVDREPR